MSNVSSVGELYISHLIPQFERIVAALREDYIRRVNPSLRVTTDFTRYSSRA